MGLVGSRAVSDHHRHLTAPDGRQPVQPGPDDVDVLPLGQISFFAYVPELGPGGFIPKASFELNWLPSLWALPLLGLVLGVLTGTVAHRMGWRLQRPADPSTGESPGLTA